LAGISSTLEGAGPEPAWTTDLGRYSLLMEPHSNAAESIAGQLKIMEQVENSHADRTRTTNRSLADRRLKDPTQRSRATNHADLLPGLDGRSSAARRFRDLVSAFIQDQGGLDQCSEIKLGLLRRLAATTVQSELLEAQMVNGEPVDIATLCTLASTAMRLSVRLGLERQAKPIESLQAYLTRTADEADTAA
jgi:hypothetical protein